YGKRQVLADVSFAVKSKEILLLVGLNGSGKSTLLRLLYGLIPMWTSRESDLTPSILLDRTSLLGCGPSERLSRGLAYVPQRRGVFSTLTVRENLLLSGHRLSHTARKERQKSILETFPILSSTLDRYPIAMSGGERQILALGMALIHEPKMMLLDEPFAGLSPKSIEVVKEQIIRLNQSGTTFLIVEHHIREAIALA